MSTVLAVPRAATRTGALPLPDRIASVDVLRGLVMVIMVLDHVRDYVHGDAMRFDPTDLSRTTTLLFLTRWITHVCAPIFVFLAGTSAYFQGARRGRGDLSRRLLTRGAWLVLLECTAIRIPMWFNVDYHFLALLQVIWVIGVSMMVLAALVHLPVRWIALFGLALIAMHNAFDGVRVVGWAGPGSTLPGAWAQIWIVLHQSNEMLPLFGSGPVVWILYPLVPWVGVMAAGYAFGTCYDLDGPRRRTLLVRLGAASLAVFVMLRAVNIYGDPAPWQVQPTAVFTLLSFVNLTKYPPSLLYLLLTLGLGLLALAWLDARPRLSAAGRALETLGRVPLFFYFWQWPLAHGLAVAATLLAGKNADYLFKNPPAFFTTAPANAGFGLTAVYASWVLVVVILFVLCRWFAGVKARRRDWWLSYL